MVLKKVAIIKLQKFLLIDILQRSVNFTLETAWLLQTAVMYCCAWGIRKDLIFIFNVLLMEAFCANISYYSGHKHNVFNMERISSFLFVKGFIKFCSLFTIGTCFSMVIVGGRIWEKDVSLKPLYSGEKLRYKCALLSCMLLLGNIIAFFPAFSLQTPSYPHNCRHTTSVM